MLILVCKDQIPRGASNSGNRIPICGPSSIAFNKGLIPIRSLRQPRGGAAEKEHQDRKDPSDRKATCRAASANRQGSGAEEQARVEPSSRFETRGSEPAMIRKNLMRRILLPCLVFLSGACALTYEITWGRMFSVLFGNSTYALSVVVAVFMGGLALGGFLLGRAADRSRKPLLMYALVEAGIGVSAFWIPFLLQAADPWIAALYASGVPPAGKLLAVRLSISVLILFVPTAFMGATLPIMSKLTVRNREDVGEKVGLFYGLNAAGAMAGCSLTGLCLLPGIGVAHSAYLASATNILIALCALGLHVHETRNTETVPSGLPNFPAPAAETVELPKAASLWVLTALFVSGVTSLSYELLWSRVLGFIFLTGMSIISFTAVVTLFLGGIAVGSLLYARTARRIQASIQTLGALQILTAGSVYAFFWALARYDMAHGFHMFDSWLNRSVKALILMGIPTICMGYAFPMACDLVTDNWKVLGRTVGRAYAVNTLGCVLGPLLTGFFLIPWLGSEITLKTMVVLGAFVGVLLLFQGSSSFRIRIVGSLMASALLIALVGGPHRILMHLLNRTHAPVVYFHEGSTGSYLALQKQYGIEVMEGGEVGAGTTPPYITSNEMAAYLPLLLKPAPTDVVSICFGTGRTPGFMARDHRVRHIDAVEIMDEALKAGDTLFSTYNHHVLHSRKVSVILDDGFNFMKYTPRRYDVISVDPFTPRNAGAARLYSRDFLQSAREHLKPDGMVTLWAGPHQMPLSTFLLILATFRSVFPHTTVWQTPDQSALFLVGTPAPLRIDLPGIQERLATRPPPDRYPWRITDASGFLSLLTMDETAVQVLADSNTLPLFTTDRPNLEYLFLSRRFPLLDRWYPFYFNRAAR